MSPHILPSSETLGASIFNGVHQRPLGNISDLLVEPAAAAAVGKRETLFFLLLQHPQVPVAIFLSPLLTLYLRMRFFFLDWLAVAIISFLLSLD